MGLPANIFARVGGALKSFCAGWLDFLPCWLASSGACSVFRLTSDRTYTRYIAAIVGHRQAPANVRAYESTNLRSAGIISLLAILAPALLFIV